MSIADTVLIADLAGTCETLEAEQRPGHALDQSLEAQPASGDGQVDTVLARIGDGILNQTLAGELDIPLGTVKSRLRLAMARLKQALGEMP